MSARRVIRVLVVDDDEDFARSLGRLIMRAQPLELVGVALNTDAAIQAAAATAPDVAIVDVMLPGGGGDAVASALGDNVRIVAMSGHRDAESVFGMLCAGACAYLVKGAPWDEVLRTICEAAAGHATLSAAVVDTVVGGLAGELERRGGARATSSNDRRLVEHVLAERTLHIEWQPIVALEHGGITGAEALARFDDSSFAGPHEWFAAASRVGLKVELELLALELAVAGAAQLPPTVYAAVNASPETLHDPRLPGILTACDRRIAIELSEQSAVEDYEQLLEALVELRAAGMLLAIDDAGAGFASLRHVLELAPDVIKLDQTLVHAIDHDHRRRALAAALMTFARETSAIVVAEGVETRDELRALRRLGVHHGQGWLLGRPQPLAPGDFATPVTFPESLPDETAASGIDIDAAAGELPSGAIGLLAAAESVTAVLQRHLGDTATVAVAQLDADFGRWRVVGMHGPRAKPPGWTTALEGAPQPLLPGSRDDDVMADRHAAGHNLVRALGGRSFCQIPILGGSGAPMLSLLAIDQQPQAFGPVAADLLAAGARVLVGALRRELSGAADEALCLREVITLDPVAGVLNRAGWEDRADRACRSVSADTSSALVVVTLDGLERVRDEQGAANGDLAIRAAGRALAEVAKPGDVVGRYDEQTFAVLVLGRRHEQDVDACWRAAVHEFASHTGQRLGARLDTTVHPLRPGCWRDTLAGLREAAA